MEKQNLPNSTVILVLGILSIVGCCCYGLPGLISGIIAIILASKSTRLYKENPEIYSGYGNVTAGKIMAIVGIILSVMFIIFIIWLISVFGWATLQDPELFQEKLLEMQHVQ